MEAENQSWLGLVVPSVGNLQDGVVGTDPGRLSIRGKVLIEGEGWDALFTESER